MIDAWDISTVPVLALPDKTAFDADPIAEVCGLQVAVHDAITRADGIAFRCTLTGSDGDRWLEVPAWMFDRG